MKLLLHHRERLCRVLQFNQSHEIRPASQILISLLFQLNQKPTTLASRPHLRQPSIPTRRNWRVVKEEEAGAANEAQAIVAITAEIENQFVPEGIVENETRTLGEERAETAMKDGVMILAIGITGVEGIAENETKGVGAQAKTVHGLVLENDGGQAIAHVVVVERGETVPVVANGYVLQVLLPEVVSSKNGS